MLPHFDELANAYEEDEDDDVEVIERGKFLEAKFAHLYWTPCAAHCLDLMLEDIFKIPSLKRTFEMAIVVHGFIYNRPTLLKMMRQFTQMKELIKPAKTRFCNCLSHFSKDSSTKKQLEEDVHFRGMDNKEMGRGATG
ncbi:hypothetical protein CKAN_00162500 [Cinnamomum micranthum f. kanehirae]|uniref:DUF659 domain-containing protein n=1 Tax=Cinnamomum micranthum f. kanehirae TaxID=337451 RepID=A0A443N4B7_9MAGN|nr:hypothetical protein CKAN_00162500 [Cinnamomum micranthum f. kanehirae]